MRERIYWGRIHDHKRSFPPACSRVVYPLIRQGSRGLIADGIIGCNTWLLFQEDVVGRMSTTID